MTATVKNFKPLLILCLIVAWLSLSFWLLSRYPALNAKALMGGQTALSGIGFDVLMPVNRAQPILTQIVYNAINWGYTNIKGMSFGLLLAPVILSIFSLLSTQSKNPLLASAMGVLAGAPLGLCANCATPIAQGVYSAKGRLETMLAIIVSSPSLNIIVLSMMFALLPLYMVLIKLACVCIILFVAIPIISRAAPASMAPPTMPDADVKVASMFKPKPYVDDSWLGALVWVWHSLVFGFVYILKIALPFMLLAGFLGAVLITLLPPNLFEVIQTTGYVDKILMLFAVSTVGALLPVPMAFDVVLAANLYELNIEPRYLMALLTTLGPFSIYPLMVVWRTASRRIALAMLLVVISLGFIAGLAAHYTQPLVDAAQQQKLFTFITENPEQLHTVSHSPSRLLDTPPAGLAQRSQELIYEDDKLKITGLPFAPRQPAASRDGLYFDRDLGPAWGIDTGYEFSVLSRSLQTAFRGIASGDINKDGWSDILLADTTGARLFLNDRGQRFVEVLLPLSSDFKAYQVTVAAMADLNNDSYLDIVLALANKGLFWLPSDNGVFASEPIKLPNLDRAMITSSLSFADVDRDGDLDIVAGNWSAGEFVHDLSVASSTNALLLNEPSGFSAHALTACMAGETLSTLLTDYNQDGHIDLIVGNDFRVPDCFALGDSSGQFVNDNAQFSKFSTITWSTMGYTSADVNNDGLMDLFASNVSQPRAADTLALTRAKDICAPLGQSPAHYRLCLQRAQLLSDVANKHTPSACQSINDSDYRVDCIASVFINGRVFSRDYACELAPDSWQLFRQTCLNYQQAMQAVSDELPLSNHLKFGNSLHIQHTPSLYRDEAAAWGVEHNGWNWNAKFSDLNNDGWQDLYIVNGFYSQASRESNQLMLNIDGRRFDNITASANAGSHQITSSYTYIDIDNDGDNDIVSNPMFGPVEVYKNVSGAGSSIRFTLQNNGGNTSGVGAKMMVYTNGSKQIRALTLGGGFVSYDAVEAHFGVANNAGIDQFEIVWPNGDTHRVSAFLKADYHYTIVRKHFPEN